MRDFKNIHKAMGLVATKMQNDPRMMADKEMLSYNNAALELFTNTKPVFAMVDGRMVDVKRAVSRRIARIMKRKGIDWKALWTTIIEFVEEHWWEILKIAISIFMFML